MNDLIINNTTNNDSFLEQEAEAKAKLETADHQQTANSTAPEEPELWIIRLSATSHCLSFP